MRGLVRRLWVGALLLASVMPAARALDLARFADALERESSRVRVAAGRAPLTVSRPARMAAGWQAAHMASTNELSHRNPAPGRRTIGDRLHAAGATYAIAGENAALNFQLNYTPGRAIYPRAGARGELIVSYSPNGLALAPHSAESFARAVVAQWLASSGHRRNLLEPRMTRIGCAIAPAPPKNPEIAALGRLMVAQVLYGEP